MATEVAAAGPRGIVARGLGRSYGDAAQNAGGTVLDLRGLTGTGQLDELTGLITCQAGLSIDMLLAEIVPRGWFVSVTPGTRQVSIGGAIAADVHGKNHHRDGSLGAHVTRLVLVDGQGEIHELSPHDKLFWATIGGMGLTGVIVEATLRLRRVDSSWMSVDTYRSGNLDDTLGRLTATDATQPYSVAWVDCLAGGARFGRGIVTAADHASTADLPAKERSRPLRWQPGQRLAAPPWAPSHLLNPVTVAAFNEMYYRRAPVERQGEPQHAAGFFHPLDVMSGWNRLYGRAGFVQYQFVSPDAAAVETALHKLRKASLPGFLAVLKRMGPADDGILSFPAPGWTLAVDIPAAATGLARVLDTIDELVAASGGRVYLAKDARLRPELVELMYPRLGEWRAARDVADPGRRFRSDLSERLGL